MTSTIPEKLYGIIGHPLGHTMSPLLHNWGFQEHGIRAVYMAWPIAPDKLKDFVNAMRLLPISGLSITIPHKEPILELLDEVSDRARSIGAVNTLYWRNDMLVGENTDVLGFMLPLREMGKKFDSALVLGAGGASRAVLAGLKELGVRDIAIANRSLENAEKLAKEFQVRVLPWEQRTKADTELLVNTTPLGMSGALQDKSPWPQKAFQANQTAYDLVYNPHTTLFLNQAREAGCVIVPGLRMFVGQAREQFGLWTGKELNGEKASNLVSNALGLA